MHRIIARMCCLAALVIAGHTAAADEPTYGEDLAFLKRHTKVVELVDGDARVAVCPEWQGRVMTSTCAGLNGPSFGWINREFIEAGQPSKVFNNYGGEDRFWLAPEAGQFGLWFAPGVEQTFANWFTPPALNDGPFEVVSGDSNETNLKRRVQLTNASRASFDFEVQRTIAAESYNEIVGDDANEILDNTSLDRVAFASRTTFKNLGQPMSKESGLASIWILGMFKPGKHVAIVAPYSSGDEKRLGPIYNDDYFAALPDERLKVLPNAVLFHGDGEFRSKIGIPQNRAFFVAGSIDFDRQCLTIMRFTMSDAPSKDLYLNNQWQLPQSQPYAGDVFNAYNDGPVEPGAASLGGFYELESLSPAKPLATGDEISHWHVTFHFQGDMADLDKLAEAMLGVELEAVRRAMGWAE